MTPHEQIAAQAETITRLTREALYLKRRVEVLTEATARQSRAIERLTDPQHMASVIFKGAGK